MTYGEALDYLMSLEVFGIRLGLGRIEKLLKLLGEPQKKFKSLHVTGTNGKGSVSAMLAAVLRAAGLKTGLYTSPHLTDYTERIAINGADISREDFAQGLERIKNRVDRLVKAGEECPTQFEVLTALAFDYFAAKKTEYAVVEVGLGGLLDSTNVIRPEVAVITNVTLEHADKCGGTLQGVARHKAGIIKTGAPTVTGAKGEPLSIIRETAKAKEVQLFVLGEDFFPDDDCQIGLRGEYQQENAALAVMAAQILGQKEPRITAEAIRDGLKQVRWPGRFELLEAQGKKILLDGAHNPAGAAALRESLDKYFPQERRVFLLGMLRDKDYAEMLRLLLRPADSVIVTVPDSRRRAEPKELASKVASAKEVILAADRDEALKAALSQVSAPGGVLIVTGSLYLIGAIRQRLFTQYCVQHYVPKTTFQNYVQ